LPHFILEYSANVLTPDFSAFFKECHSLLANQLPTKISSCRSRAIKCNDYRVGAGDAPYGFVHVTLKIMPGRTQAVLEATGQALLELLKNNFSASSQNVPLEISLEINEITNPYFKTTLPLR
jgi:5-carboxymethyl-2-hydroxymuconate isomerase